MQRYHGVINVHDLGPELGASESAALVFSNNGPLFLDMGEMIRVDAPTVSFVSAVAFRVHTNPSM